MVAAATNNLCEAANSAVQGHASEEKLISSAKQVAASTAQLLVACKVKADQDSQTMKRLQVSVCVCLMSSLLVLMQERALSLEMKFPKGDFTAEPKKSRIFSQRVNTINVLCNGKIKWMLKVNIINYNIIYEHSADAMQTTISLEKQESEVKTFTLCYLLSSHTSQKSKHDHN